MLSVPEEHLVSDAPDEASHGRGGGWGVLF